LEYQSVVFFTSSIPIACKSPKDGVPDNNIDKIYDSEARPSFNPGYDPLELDPFFSMEESGDRGQGQIFALKIWLDPKEFSRAKTGKLGTCQASSGVRCWSDGHTHHGV